MSGFSLEEVFRAYFDCRRSKRNTAAQAAFEQRLERNLMSLHRDLNDRTYEIGRTRAFVVTVPKVREVWAGQFRDRVVHHIMYNRLFERFHRSFIFDTYACIPGRGVLFGANRVHGFMRRSTQNWQHEAWFLQCDLANFFVSINKEVLWSLVEPEIHEPELRWLTRKIVFHDPTLNPIYTSPREMFSLVPLHKRLAGAGGNGLLIGNLSSQYFANVYLNPLDHFIKRDLGIKHYGRYVDDLVLIGSDMDELNKSFELMQDFAWDRLRVRFHPRKTQRNLVRRGINFCGHILKPYRKYVRRSITRSMFDAVLSAERESDLHAWRARVNSYLGHCRHADTYRLRKALAKVSREWFGPKFLKVYI